jgi:metal-responsive CopG/Arc/MetJ family transcriptional regulator
MKKAQKNHDRAPGETQITVSLPQWLKDELTALATQEERSRSNWIVRELKALVAHKKAESHTHKKRSSG